MLLLQHHQDKLRLRLSIIGIPKYTINPFVDLLVRWERCSGVEWTISRLKSLKVDLIRRHSGLEPLTWIRRNRNGDIYGTLGSIFRYSDHNDRSFGRAIQAFMAYSFYILPSLTESQKEKFLSGINPGKINDDIHDDFHYEFHNTVEQFIPKQRVRLPEPYVLYNGSDSKKSPRLFSQKSTPQSENLLDDLQLFNTDGGRWLYSKFERIYSPLLYGCKERRDHLASYARGFYAHMNRFGSVPKPTILGGEIHFLQEPGGKLRSVASPFRIHQQALEPLGSMLFSLVKTLPWDCTFDQSKALPYIQDHLFKGNTVHSVDLSSATDLFPLSIQLTALRSIIDRRDWDHIQLFEEISRSSWKSQIGQLSWTKGQPLGLYPSFAAFTLTHGLILLHLAGCFNNQFFVVGDDVVILDDDLREKYITFLNQAGCKWSPDKSISSNSLSEFAGKIITPSKVIPQLKWRKISNDNFLDICRLLGRKSRLLLSKRQKIVFDQVAHLCDPIGLNFSLQGDNLEKMVMRTMDFYQPEKHVLRSLMGLRKKFNRLVYSSSENLSSDELLDLSATFDEKVKSAMFKTLFTRWETCLQIGLSGLNSLPEALGLEPRLPLEKLLPSRQTILDRYESLLRKQ